MPIGNQEIWDKGIGAGATNVIFGQPAQTNFNPGALGADPNAQAATPAATQGIIPEAAPAAIPAAAQAAVPNKSSLVPENYSGQMGTKFYVNGQEVSPEQYQQYKEQLRNESNQKVMNFAMTGGGSSNPALRTGGGKFMQSG